MPSQRPQDLVFTLFGEYLLPRARPVWVGSLISLLCPFGVSEGAVRTVLSRMSRKGWLESRRRGRHSFYNLTRRGTKLLEEGKARIFHPTWREAWDGRWYLVTYSIPEETRHLRDRLRMRLAWLGFGSLGNGIWISPHDVGERVAEMAEAMGIQDHLICFEARYRGGMGNDELVDRCWNLLALNRRYAAFLERWTPRLQAEGDGLRSGRSRDEACYVDRFRLIHEFRDFPLKDPYLPRSLLPDDWHGQRAAQVFADLRDRLTGPSDRYVDEILRAEPQPADRIGVTA